MCFCRFLRIYDVCPRLCLLSFCYLLQPIYRIAVWLPTSVWHTIGDIHPCVGGLVTRNYNRLDKLQSANVCLHLWNMAFETISLSHNYFCASFFQQNLLMHLSKKQMMDCFFWAHCSASRPWISSLSTSLNSSIQSFRNDFINHIIIFSLPNHYYDIMIFIDERMHQNLRFSTFPSSCSRCENSRWDWLVLWGLSLGWRLTRFSSEDCMLGSDIGWRQTFGAGS